MLTNQPRAIRRLFGVTVAVALLYALGCGRAVYPVRGKVVFEKGDISRLTYSNVEVVKDNDSNVRAAGEIGADGSFVLQSRLDGKVRSGVPEGSYQGRIYLTGEEDEEALFRKAGVDPKFLDFKTSGVVVKVPTDGEITITVTPAKRGAKLPKKEDQPSTGAECR
jgi:hypothetical protein